MKYKAGDKVRIKSLDWYTSNKNKLGEVWTESLDGESQICFDSDMIPYCGMETVIFSVERENYALKGIPYAWTDEMLEAVNTDSPIIGLMPDSEGHELMIHEDYEVKQKNGKFYLVKKRPSYPKTYEECCYVLGFENTDLVFEDDYRNINPPKEQWKRLGLMNQLNKLLICRDAYWKIAGDWKPDWAMYSGPKHCIIYSDNQIKWQGKSFVTEAKVLAFPTKEMRDAFKENFDPDIENCKEFL